MTFLVADKIINSGKNLFLTGSGGVGKSRWIRETIDRMRIEGKNVVVLSPTGCAAINISGFTIHGYWILFS